jgi:DNA polymerase III epsilon subunit-like protein
MMMDTESRNRILVFDTETTGFPPKIDRSNGAPVPNISEYPLILQLSFIIYDLNTQSVVQEYNQYVRIADNAFIPEKTTEIHGITKDICNSRGIPIERILHDFYIAYMSVDRIIGHNLAFDRKMVEIEILRNIRKLSLIPDIMLLFNETFNDVNDIETICTMMKGKDVCNLYLTNERTGSRWKKQPKLSELHFALFNFVPDNLHDALMDTKVCLRCYLKMSCGIEM